MEQQVDSRPQVIVQQAPSNNLALAGFITSLVGLIMCAGIICPVGAVLSFLGMAKQPRGFAIAGLVIGIIGTIPMLIFLVLIALGIAGEMMQ